LPRAPAAGIRSRSLIHTRTDGHVTRFQSFNLRFQMLSLALRTTQLCVFVGVLIAFLRQCGSVALNTTSVGDDRLSMTGQSQFSLGRFGVGLAM
jgi:hypothetical protein